MHKIPKKLRLKGSLITLRSPEDGDEDRMLEIFSDPKTTEHLGPLVPEEGWTRETVREFFEIRRKAQMENKCIHLSMIENATGKMIGSAGCRHVDFQRKMANLGILLSPAYWGTGVAAEAGLLLMKFLFDRLGIEEIELQMLAENVRAAGLCSRLGLKSSGIQKNTDIPGLEDVDLLTFYLRKGDVQQIKAMVLDRIGKQSGSR